MSFSISLSAVMAFCIGTLLGSLASIGYFLYLSRQVRAIAAANSLWFSLLLGAALRIACLLAGGWFVLMIWGPLSAIGYASAFLLVRSIAIHRAHHQAPNANDQNSQRKQTARDCTLYSKNDAMKRREESSSCN